MAKASQSEDNSTLRKGSWSVEEDQKLIAYISRYGIWNWQEMAKSAGLQRSGKSCRLRWVNYLKPGIKHGNFTREEEETVIELRGMLGNRWSVIASKLPGRTDNEIKNYWHSHLSKRLKYSSMPTSTVFQIPNVETEPNSSYNTHFSPPKATKASNQEDSGSTKLPFPQYSSHGLSSPSTVMSAADINKNQTNQDTLGPSRSVGELQKHVESG